MTPRPTPSPQITVLTLVVLAVGLVGGLGACASRDLGTGVSAPRLVQDEVLDIQVARRSTKISMTNTTARSFPAGRLWINKGYSAPMPPLAVGETVELDLRVFVDEAGEPFRAGGFFATREGDLVVLAHLVIEGRTYGLVVVENEF
jgi:hypothetical protein